MFYCPTCGVALSTQEVGGGSQIAHVRAATTVRFAGFWIRVVADILDSLLLWIPVMAANFVLPFFGGCTTWVAYKSIFLAHWNGQTPGKRACGIRVVDRTLTPCTPGQAFGRTMAEFVSTVILLIGYGMAAFDGKKRALHDRMAGTVHVYDG